ncbi:gastric triacylglycerol lipase-like [Dreissena polymorpha]|uniref:AB hydrolase-1 domain-containing protein n=1 Tax=Dreissena polymorpha TaxID=45954 RepID=A0A9D4M2U6_DREPO|nr:gastric triacylglycerol lipase-like [Dreissena polymorpha]KAH3869735.1 hypothetical protein DPMN_032904 [Dreissena polymorpha]
MLADAGFDVWLGNSRENTYGRRHMTLNTTDKEFWQFSWDQMAQQDLPAAIDRILAITGVSSLFYGGHSQGGAIMYALMSHDPSYATKVKLFVAHAPAVYGNTMTSPIKYIAPFSKGLGPIGELLTHGELLPHSEVYDFLAKYVCNQAIIPELFCENLLFVISGFDVEQMNISRVPVYMGTHPAGTSIQNLLHFAQMVENPNFQMYDYGPAENMKIYHQKTPPVYDMSNATMTS